MKVWMTRDKKEPLFDNYEITFFTKEPSLEQFWFNDGGEMIEMDKEAFKKFFNLPLPRKGSKKLVELEINLKEVE